MAERQGDSLLLALLIRFGANAAALWVASELIDGFQINGWQSVLAMAFIFGIVNAFITPVVQLLGCPLTMLTLGLFALVINGLMLSFAVWLGESIGIDVTMDGFLDAFFAALLISIVSWFLSAFIGRPIRWAMR